MDRLHDVHSSCGKRVHSPYGRRAHWHRWPLRVNGTKHIGYARIAWFNVTRHTLYAHMAWVNDTEALSYGYHPGYAADGALDTVNRTVAYRTLLCIKCCDLIDCTVIDVASRRSERAAALMRTARET